MRTRRCQFPEPSGRSAGLPVPHGRRSAPFDRPAIWALEQAQNVRERCESGRIGVTAKRIRHGFVATSTSKYPGQIAVEKSATQFVQEIGSKGGPKSQVVQGWSNTDPVIGVTCLDHFAMKHAEVLGDRAATDVVEVAADRTRRHLLRPDESHDLLATRVPQRSEREIHDNSRQFILTYVSASYCTSPRRRALSSSADSVAGLRLLIPSHAASAR